MIALLAALVAVADPAPAAAAAPSMQALFDTASAAVDAGRCADAVRDFEAIEARRVRDPAVAAVVALRKGRCLADLGRRDEAVAALTAGLGGVGDAPVYVTDRALALVARGRIAYDRLDYPAAVGDLTAARDLLPPEDRFEPLVWLARATMFDPGDAAQGYADAALAVATARTAKPTLVAYVRTLHARIRLNHGDIRGGYAELRQALDAQGGLTLRVDSKSIATRADLATAAILSNDPESARKYLTYTGAGHGTPFGIGAEMDPPPCDGVDLTPDDRAVVEFGIGDDGAVVYATPVYASRLGGTAVAFARAVAGWSWRPDALAKVAPLFRNFTRVELRCSTASASPPITALIRRDAAAWLAARGVAPFVQPDGAAAAIPVARADLARRRAAGGDEVGLVPVLIALGDNAAAPAADRRAALAEARQIAARAHAPAPVTTYLAVLMLDIGDDDRAGFARRVAARRAGLRDLLADPAVAADPRSRGVVRLLIATGVYRAPPPPDAAGLLRTVADDAALPPADPLRSAAHVRLASLLARGGDLDGARAAYAASGVTAQQCSLVDARPALASAGNNFFPTEAQRWGFEGWVRVEFDVGADGHTAASRAVIAYPPFVFSPSAVAASRGWRYQQTFRPDGVAGCTGAEQQIRFRIG